MNTREQYQLAWKYVRLLGRATNDLDKSLLDVCLKLDCPNPFIRFMAGRSWANRQYVSDMRESLRNKAVDRLTERYKAEIRDNWVNITEKLTFGDLIPDDDIQRVYLGSVFSIVPSGKFWAFWANNNVSELESMRDTAFMEALESVASEHGGWIENGEGDPTDLYFCISLDSEDSND